MAHPGGRPPKYSDELVARICVHLRHGTPRAWAAQAEGLHKDTFYDWLQRHPEFSDAVQKAEAQARTDNIAVVKAAAARGDWKAAAWLLERLAPEEFAGRAEVRHTGAGGGPVEVKHSYERERPDRVFDILHAAGIIALNAGAAPDPDDAASDAVR